MVMGNKSMGQQNNIGEQHKKYGQFAIYHAFRKVSPNIKVKSFVSTSPVKELDCTLKTKTASKSYCRPCFLYSIKFIDSRAVSLPF
jgi:hypothetical protein